MKTLLKNNNFLQNLLFSVLSLLLFCSLNGINAALPLSCSLYVGLLYAGVGITPLALSFIVSFLIFKSWAMLLTGVVFALFYGLIFFVYGKKSKVLGAEIIVYTLIGLTPYFCLDIGVRIVKKLVYASIIEVFSFISIIGAVGFFKKLKGALIKLSQEVSAALIYAICAVGFIKLFDANAYRPLALAAFLLAARYYKSPQVAVWAALFSIPLTLFDARHQWLTAFLVFYATSVLFRNAPSLIISVAFFAADMTNGLFLGLYPSYGYVQAIPAAILLFIVGLVPSQAIKKLRQKRSVTPQDKLIKSVISSQRSQTASKLYEVAGVFYQMQDAFDNLKKCAKSTDSLIDRMAEDTLYNMCAACSLRERCKSAGLMDKTVIEKVIRIGIAKGKVSLIDLSRDFTEICAYPNSIIYEVNRLIGQYYEYINQAETGDKSKEILSLQANGAAVSMKALAFELSKSMPENNILERKISRSLARLGISVESVMAFGAADDLTVALTVADDDFDIEDFLAALSYSANAKLTVTQKEILADDSIFFTLRPTPPFDAVFGVSKITKAGSSACGDCHSLVKIDENNFLIALADGMGSGETAQSTSAAALNLIESLYKAGLDSEFILNMVNKLLSITIDDNFSAIDVALCNLKEGTTSFIKIGSPYGFILSNDGIRFVEGSSLPLGILDDLHPTTASASLSDGDVIVLVSDGITDAFGSSGDFVEFLKTVSIKNPQNLADEIVKRALNLCSNVAPDDMTALCVRLVDKSAA